MKLLIACLATETNSFSPIPTGDHAFESTVCTRHATDQPGNLFTAPLHVWKARALSLGWQVAEGLSAAALPAGPTLRHTYERLREEIMADVRASQPDIVLLSLHGAMVAQGYDDCEGDLLGRIRSIVGRKVIIGAELDPHTLLTPQMMDHADLLVPYKEYPHSDSAERADELFTMAADMAAGQIQPVMRQYDCRMITMYRPPLEPMRGYVDDMKSASNGNGILHVGLIHTFPWGDTASVGTRVLAITDGDADLAEATARRFGERLWQMREHFRVRWPDIAESLDRCAAAGQTPVILADTADNAGCGAPSDSTFVLREIIARGMKDVAIGYFYDPMVVRLSEQIGEGAEARVRLGGKICEASGDPLDLNVTVRAIRKNVLQYMGTTPQTLDTVVWLESNGVHILVVDVRAQPFSTHGFTETGIDLSTMRAVVVKSGQHFYDAFAAVGAEVIYMRGPGATSPDYAAIPYSKRDGNYWPRVEDPFAPREAPENGSADVQ